MRCAPRSSSAVGGSRDRADDRPRARSATSAGDDLGTVLFFEDVSQIAKVERMEAWREVARRIAHEIKNPLTPIQLSAERLRRQLDRAIRRRRRAWSTNAPAPLSARSRTLKRLVNEFSAFARMPHLNPLAGRSQPAGRGDGQRLSRRQSRRRLRAGPRRLRSAADRDRSRGAQARAGQSARQCGRAAVERQSQRRRGRESSVHRSWTREAAWSRSKCATMARESIRRAAHADFRAVLFHQARAAPGSAWRLSRLSSPTIMASSGCATTRRDGSRFVLEFPVKEQQFAKVLS